MKVSMGKVKKTEIERGTRMSDTHVKWRQRRRLDRRRRIE